MWTYNVVRALIRHSGLTPFPDEVPKDETPFLKCYKQPLDSKEIFCIKSHEVINPEIINSKIISPYRDVRESLASFIAFSGSSFKNALLAVRYWMSNIDYYYDNNFDNVLLIRYEDITQHSLDTIVTIQDFIGSSVTPEILDKIDYSHSRKTIKSRIDELDSINSDHASNGQSDVNFVQSIDGSSRVFDKSTGFQSNHITSLEDGYWKKILTSDQQDELLMITSDWLQKHNFKI